MIQATYALVKVRGELVQHEGRWGWRILATVRGLLPEYQASRSLRSYETESQAIEAMWEAIGDLFVELVETNPGAPEPMPAWGKPSLGTEQQRST